MHKKGLLGRKAKFSGAAAVLIAGGLAMWLAAAFAASPNGQAVTESDNVHGVFYDPGAANPCNGDTFNGAMEPVLVGPEDVHRPHRLMGAPVGRNYQVGVHNGCGELVVERLAAL